MISELDALISLATASSMASVPYVRPHILPQGKRVYLDLD